MPYRRSPHPITITKQQARTLILQHQLLSSAPTLKGKRRTLKTIECLGYIQIDTINVIDRSHHIVLLTRNKDYLHDHLHTLQSRDKKIFEYWAHAASYIPTTDFRYYLRKMKDEHIYENWMSKWMQKYPGTIRQVKQRIKKEGSLAASDFVDTRNRKRGPWWDWKPAKAALEILFWKGELMIKERRNFQRVYDLTERVIPDHVDRTLPTIEEEEKFFITRALNAMGVATIQDINRYIHSRRKFQDTLLLMKQAGEIKKVTISGLDKPYFMLGKTARRLSSIRDKNDDRVYLLSPFDNAVILRDRTDALFEFQYVLECYTPPKKRKYGYFCLPILWHDNLVGRIDPKADRQNNILWIKSVYLEKPDLLKGNFFRQFAHCLQSFAAFHKCESIKIDRVVPKKFKRDITRHFA